MSISRRVFLASGCLALSAVFAPGLQAEEIADLKTQLKSVLKARRPQDFAFIDLVVAKVDSGDLPRPLVNTAFDYAKRRKPYPYPYFEEAMKRLARQIGVDLGPPSN